MTSNPFTSEPFASLWQQHFNRGRPGRKFRLFGDLGFIKKASLPLYINVGTTHTKGISYKPGPADAKEIRNKVFLIYDVPAYFSIPAMPAQGTRGAYRIGQYPGFLIELSGFKDLNAYMQGSFSKSSRYKLNKYKKRLEQAFDIRYTMYWGTMERETYERLFAAFRALLEKRFGAKQTTNNNLNAREWDFYEAVAYPMILEKKAALFVVYDGETPIAITLNYLADTLLFDAITVFDTDYAKFHLGSVSIMALIAWCLANDMSALDFSKGYFDYKKHWATREYAFEYHLYYDAGSLRARGLAYLLKAYFEGKQYLRERGVNERLNRLRYRLQPGNVRKGTNMPAYTFGEVPEAIPEISLQKIAPGTPLYRFLKPILFDFLYLSSESYRDTGLYEIKGQPVTYLLAGAREQRLVQLNSPPQASPAGMKDPL